MSNFKTLDLSSHWGGGVTVKGADVKNVSRKNIERAQQETLQRIQAGKTSTRTVHLDANYTQAATHNLTQHDVTVRETIMSRVSNAPEQVQQKIESTLNALERNRQNFERLESRSKVAAISGDSKAVEKFDRQMKQSALMMSAISEELRVAYIAGPQTTSFDQNNSFGRRPGFRSDIEMQRVMIEVTIGEKKPSKQLEDYMLSAKQTGKALYLHGPLLTKAGVKRAERYGFTVGRNYEDIFTFITRPKMG